MRALSALLLLPALLQSSVAYSALSDASLASLPAPEEDFDIHTGALLSPILRTRVPGSPGSQAVLFHFVDFFAANLPDWKITFQNSTSTTPIRELGELPFTNLIATRDPPWVERDGEVGRLALVAHYDSKYEPEGFIGAIDSAAPCAMILHAARSIDEALTKKWEAMEASGVNEYELDNDANKGVQVILLDGEEAFLHWTATDSLYGARALAEEWETTMYPAMSSYATPLASIDLFVLLDLLGSANPTVPSYFQTSHWAYRHMASIETRLRGLGKFKSSPNFPGKKAPRQQEPKFLINSDMEELSHSNSGIQDDHLPFMLRGVEILHMIPSFPFPTVWHTLDDDGEHLDIDTCEDWAVLVTAFLAEWMDLEGYLDATPREATKRSRHDEDGKSELYPNNNE